MSTQTEVYQPSAGGMPLTQKRESLWADALRRLLRNRAAVLGSAIVLLLILAAVLAPVIAPYSYETQILTDNNKVPSWMISVFPGIVGYAKTSDKYPLGARSGTP